MKQMLVFEVLPDLNMSESHKTGGNMVAAFWNYMRNLMADLFSVVVF